MKYFFLINPAAGKGRGTDELAEKIRRVCLKRNAEFFIHKTKGVGDARAFCERVSLESLSSAEKDRIAFFACGGDGTLSEVANGTAGYSHVSVGLIPSGTGNDFARNFTNPHLFFDINAQLDGSTVAIDLIRAGDVYCINMINIGFDCEAVVAMSRFKRKYLPIKFAYTLGIASTLIKKPGVTVKISVDGKESEYKNLLLLTFANGGYCGGGFNSNPNAHPCDNLIDSVFVNNVSRFKFLRLVGEYKKGMHLTEKHRDFLSNINFEYADMEFGIPQNVSIDGEIYKLNSLRLENASEKLNFILPSGVVRKNSAMKKVLLLD